MKYARINTIHGILEVELYEKETPGTVKNFVKLAESGYYNGLNFHRVIPEFVVQGGCPDGTGAGGPGYQIKCEVNAEKQHHDQGILSMAHAGRDTGGSQFFICLSRKGTAHLDGNHTCFGKVVKGLELIDNLRQGDKMEKVEIFEKE